MQHCFCSSLPITITSNKELSQDDEDELENGGDVKPDTKRRRKKAAEDFSNYLTMKTGFDLEYFVDDKNNESARDLFTETLGRYFWSYQVKVLILFVLNLHY